MQSMELGISLLKILNERWRYSLALQTHFAIGVLYRELSKLKQKNNSFVSFSKTHLLFPSDPLFYNFFTAVG